jgi:phage gp36-like protein
MFITDDDYGVEIRQEILNLLDPSTERTYLAIAQKMAIDQVKQYISGRYNTEAIFSAEANNRNMFLVMLVIDLTLYHLWSKKAPRKMPEIRSQRYQDAIDWLKGVASGTIEPELPAAPEPDQDYETGIRIESVHKPNNNKY